LEVYLYSTEAIKWMLIDADLQLLALNLLIFVTVKTWIKLRIDVLKG